MPYDFCRHIKANGKVCKSPALTDQTLCYFHRKLRTRHRELVTGQTRDAAAAEVVHELVYDGDGYPVPQALPSQTASPANAEFEMPLLEDRESVQVAISLVVSAIARNRIDPRRAAAILYGLQLASNNASHIVIEPFPPSLAPAVRRGASGFDNLPRDASGLPAPGASAKSTS